jgi:hypothetical protein
MASTPAPVRAASATAARDISTPCAVHSSAAPTPTPAYAGMNVSHDGCRLAKTSSTYGTAPRNMAQREPTRASTAGATIVDAVKTV